ncbi:hypothetical protein ACFX2F_042085 [Malus domestica]
MTWVCDIGLLVVSTTGNRGAIVRSPVVQRDPGLTWMPFFPSNRSLSWVSDIGFLVISSKGRNRDVLPRLT